MTLAAADVLRAAPRLRGGLELPSDKSIAHRALICAALASGESRIKLVQPGADVLSTFTALRSLGVAVDKLVVGDEFVALVEGLGDSNATGRLGEGMGDCGNSGTSMRLLTGALASGRGTGTLIGDASLSSRPMERVAEPLRAMGAEVVLTDGHAPVVVRGRHGLKAIDHRLGVASAQVLASISFAAIAADGATTIRVPGAVRDHTERMLSALGAEVERTSDPHASTTVVLGPSGLRSMWIDVPGDFSSAAAWIVAGALHPEAEVDLFGVGLNPTRTALLDVLRSMGATITARIADEQAGEPVGEIHIRGGAQLHSTTLGPDEVAPLIDELPLLAVAMAAADGVSEVRGAGELRVKESDRIAAICAALTAAGANFEELEDGWRISRGTPRDARVVTHSDHRIAMAMAVAAWAGVAQSVELDDPSCVAISYPTFWDDARRIGAFA